MERKRRSCCVSETEMADERAHRARLLERRFVSRIEPRGRLGCLVAQPRLVDGQHPPVLEHHAPADHHAVDRRAVLGEHELQKRRSTA